MTETKFLATLNVLALSDKQYRFIGEDIKLCTNLKSLFLFSNKIEKIENLTRCSGLTILQLDDNLLTKIEGLSNLKTLEKLYSFPLRHLSL